MLIDPTVEKHQLNQPWYSGWKWVTIHFFLSRLLVFCVVFLLPPLIAPTNSLETRDFWSAISYWDGEHYERIAGYGYNFIGDCQGYEVAFFPLFPLLVKCLMALGLSFKLSAVLLNNACFWILLLILFQWMERSQNKKVARWAVVFLAWFPLSFYCSIAYTESLFLLTTIAALLAFENKQYAWAGFWGILASATRLPGVVLIPTFFCMTFLQRRSPKGYLAALSSALGVVLYSLYCYMKFGEPLAFILVQKCWQNPPEFFLQNWWDLLMQIIFSYPNWKAGSISDPLYPLIFFIISSLTILLFLSRNNLSENFVNVAGVILWIGLWLCGGDNLIALSMMIGSVVVLFRTRNKLTSVAWLYACFGILFLILTGRTTSIIRYIFGIVPLIPALSIFLANSPRIRYSLLFFLLLFFVVLGLRFGQYDWAA